MQAASILRNFSSELTTERLYLRCPREGDGVAVHEAVVESLQHLRAWPASLPWALAEPSVAVSRLIQYAITDEKNAASRAACEASGRQPH